VAGTALFWLGLALSHLAFGAQQLPFSLTEDVAGLATARTGATVYTAVWMRPKSGPDSVEFFRRENGKWTKLGEYQNKSYAWQSISILPDGRLIGFVLRSESGDHWYGQTKVFVLLGGKIRLVFDNILSTEVENLNSDGYPDLLASGWPDGDGDPEHTEVFVWSKTRYKKALVVPFRARYGVKVISAINRFTVK
jgi:hypothetical protein